MFQLSLCFTLCFIIKSVCEGTIGLKKTLQSGRTSEHFLSQWNAIIIMSKAEINLVETLGSEYRTQTLVLQVEFWNKLTEYLEGAAEIGEARNLYAELCNRTEQAEKGISVRRRRKLSKLNVCGEALAVEQEFLRSFTFTKDLKSFWDAEHHAEGGKLYLEQEQRIDLDEMRRKLMQNNFDNQPPGNEERGSRTFGECTNKHGDMSGNNDEIQYEVKRDENGRIEGQFVNDKAINLSHRTLSQHEISVCPRDFSLYQPQKRLIISLCADAIEFYTQFFNPISTGGRAFFAPSRPHFFYIALKRQVI